MYTMSNLPSRSRNVAKLPVVKEEKRSAGGNKTLEEKGLTVNQRKFAFSIATGNNIKVSSELSGINYETGRKWRHIAHVEDEIQRLSDLLMGELQTQVTGSMQEVFEKLLEKGLNDKDGDQFRSLAQLWSSVSPTFLQRLSPAEKQPIQSDAPNEETVSVGDEAQEILDKLFVEEESAPVVDEKVSPEEVVEAMWSEEDVE